MKDPDEQHYDHEESEYHFSDDDVSYEVETETSKPAAPEPEKKNPMAALTQSKRMMISMVVFLGLVFVVYKMVSPGTTVPSTEISPVAAVQTQTITQEIAPPPLPHTVPTPEAPAPTQAETMPAAVPVQAAAAAPAQPGVAPTTTPAATATTTTTTTVVTPPTSAAPAQPVVAAPQATPAPTAAPQPIAQAVPTAPAQPQASAIPPAPLTTPVAAAPPAQQPMPVATTVVTTPAVMPANTDAAIAAMAATNEKLMMQLQSEYSQKANDFSNQNKALQENMQALNSRVAGLESQLGQLVQTLSRQTGMGGPTSLNVVPAQQPPPLPIVQPKINYNVQAIIPGRAWLKSDNGETLTVAEGDSIRELGRVTKIDPYDGVVEVNTGSKTVSISYGSGG